MSAEPLSLYQLNRQLKQAVQSAMPHRYWVRAEISEARTNYTSGHCYLELVEKAKEGSTEVIAKARGMIHASLFRMLKPYFEERTGQQFAAGIKVLVEVSINLHELYGMSLSIHDIDPTYTLGDMAQHRQAVLKQLTEDGVIDMNREVEWSALPQRIAIISSPTAAGYGDFVDQLTHNAQGYTLYTHLFPAIMQGAQTEQSVIAALDRIYAYQEWFDAVVIIRGGGATSDLSCFDSYLLALNIAQFPLPILTGIGHERDETVADSVAAVSVKTPTAAAEYLIGRIAQASNHLAQLQATITTTITDKLTQQHTHLAQLTQQIPQRVAQSLARERELLLRYEQQLAIHATACIATQQRYTQQLGERIATLQQRRVEQERTHLARTALELQHHTTRLIEREGERLELLQRTIQLTSPLTLLERGYTLTLKGGKVVKDSSELHEGDPITTLFASGQVNSIVTNASKK